MALRLRLTHKIAGLGAIGIAGLFVIGGLYLASNATQSRFRAAAEASQSLYRDVNAVRIDFLEIRRAEKDFLLRKDERYVGRHAELSRTVAAALSSLQSRTGTMTGVKADLDGVRDGFDVYAKHFAALAAARTRLGLDQDAGLEGSLRRSVHAIEQAIETTGQPGLTVSMLTMRRHEKDFMLRGDAAYGDAMKKSAAELGARLAASPLPDRTKADLAQKLAAYQADFAAWMDTALTIAREQSAMSDTFTAIEPRFDAIRRTLDSARNASVSAEADSRAETTWWMQFAIVSVTLAVGALALMIGRSVSRPMTAITAGMKRLADGDFEVVLPGLKRGDEIGAIARAVELFKVKAQEKARQEALAQAEAEARAAARRKADMHRLADQFEAAVGQVVHAVSSASNELEATARTLTHTADNTQQLSTKVSAASEEASTNVQAVAAATDEMTASIAEISRQVQTSSHIAEEAVRHAEKTDARVGELSQAANRIGDVVKLITAIAGQTNLLALNATIEATRAGEAGKGFAVVAQEVKALAAQTGKATGDIAAQISSMQAATQDSVAAIKEIGDIIRRIADISSTIAAAVEEQGAATSEIARNIQQAAAGTTQVAANITDVNRGAEETGAASTQMLTATGELAGESSRLRLEVEKFLTTVRAA